MNIDITDTHRRVAGLVRKTVAGAQDADAGNPLVLLGDGGIFDSITALELILAIEKEFAIVIKDEDVNPENLGTIDSIVRFVHAALTRDR